MIEEVRIGNCTLYRADVRELSHDLLAADTVLTDPVWPNCPPGLLQGSNDPAGLLASCVDRISARRMVLIVRHDSDPRFFRAVPERWPFFRVQILPYVMPGYIGRKLGGDELAYSFGKPIPSAPGRRLIPGYAPKVQPDGRSANGHPCSRSLKHFEWLVDWWSLPGETIIDPFMGSGTTGVASAKLGRQFIGVEIEPRYFDIACKRIEDAYRQGDLFIDGAA
jgi:hypothetical protein